MTRSWNEASEAAEEGGFDNARRLGRVCKGQNANDSARRNSPTMEGLRTLERLSTGAFDAPFKCVLCRVLLRTLEESGACDFLSSTGVYGVTWATPRRRGFPFVSATPAPLMPLGRLDAGGMPRPSNGSVPVAEAGTSRPSAKERDPMANVVEEELVGRSAPMGRVTCVWEDVGRGVDRGRKRSAGTKGAPRI